MIQAQLQKIPLQAAVLSITIRAEENMLLGIYPAMTLRGGLGYALKKIACDCNGRQHQERCVYARLYEEKPGTMHGTLYIPYTRPFIIRTRENKQRIYDAQTPYQFELILYGEAIAHLDLFIVALKKFGVNGIGEEKSPFVVEKVIENRAGKAFILYEKNRLIQGAKGCYLFDVPRVENVQKIQLQFHTPLRLQAEGEYLDHTPIEVLVDNLLRRVRSLLFFHHQHYFLADELVETLIEEAFKARVIEENYRYVSYNRVSSRQKRQAPLDGILGSTIIEQIPENIANLLSIGQTIHLGKQTVFGLGEYSVAYYG